MKKYLMVALMVFASSAMAKIGYVDEHQKKDLTKLFVQCCPCKRMVASSQT